MLDRYTRSIAAESLHSGSQWLSDHSIKANYLTGVGVGFGFAACLAISAELWLFGLLFWLLNRLFDGLDGLVARATEPTDLGGFFDIVADFAVYSGFVVAVAVALPETRLVSVVLLASYYMSGTAFLAWSGLVNDNSNQRGKADDDRSLSFLPGLAEGTETIVAYSLICLLPSRAATIMWVFGAMVSITAVQRIWWAARTL